MISCVGVCECDFTYPWECIPNPKCIVSFGSWDEEACQKFSCPLSVSASGMFSSFCRNCLAKQVEKVCESQIYCRKNFSETFFDALGVPLATLNWHASFLGIPIGNKAHQPGNGTDHRPKKACPKTTTPGMHSNITNIFRLR